MANTNFSNLHYLYINLVSLVQQFLQVQFTVFLRYMYMGSSASYMGSSASYTGSSAFYVGSSAFYMGSSVSNMGSSASYGGFRASYTGSSVSYMESSASYGGSSASYMGSITSYEGPVYPIWGPVRPMGGPVHPIRGPVCPIWSPVHPMGGPVHPIWGPLRPMRVQCILYGVQSYMATLSLYCHILYVLSKFSRINVIQWNLSKMVIELGSHLSKTASLPGPSGTKTLQSTSVEQPPLYKGQLELAHRWLS